jgi:hypothetical protein
MSDSANNERTKTAREDAFTQLWHEFTSHHVIVDNCNCRIPDIKKNIELTKRGLADQAEILQEVVDKRNASASEMIRLIKQMSEIVPPNGVAFVPDFN